MFRAGMVRKVKWQGQSRRNLRYSRIPPGSASPIMTTTNADEPLSLGSFGAAAASASWRFIDFSRVLKLAPSPIRSEWPKPNEKNLHRIQVIS